MPGSAPAAGRSYRNGPRPAAPRWCCAAAGRASPRADRGHPPGPAHRFTSLRTPARRSSEQPGQLAGLPVEPAVPGRYRRQHRPIRDSQVGQQPAVQLPGQQGVGTIGAPVAAHSQASQGLPEAVTLEQLQQLAHHGEIVLEDDRMPPAFRERLPRRAPLRHLQDRAFEIRHGAPHPQGNESSRAADRRGCSALAARSGLLCRSLAPGSDELLPGPSNPDDAMAQRPPAAQLQDIRRQAPDPVGQV